jgi:enamine deaminase RidA (YjgF/YER057c/UK114 family)
MAARILAIGNPKEILMSALTAEGRLKELGIVLPQPPTPLGAYVEAVRTGNLLFLSGTLPVEQGRARYVGRVGGELTLEQAAAATRLAALNSVALARAHLGSLDEITRIVRLSVALVTVPDFREHPKVADAASELLLSLFGRQMISTRAVLGVASLPLGVCVETEIVFEVGP